MLSIQFPIARRVNVNFSSHHGKIIHASTHFAESFNLNSSFLRFRLAGGSKCAAAANDKEKDHQIQLPRNPKPELMLKHASINRGFPVQHGHRASGHAMKQFDTNCSKISVEEMANRNGMESDDVKTAFLGVYSVLKSELLNDPAFEWTDDSRQWVEQMLDFNVPGGKLNRGLSVVESYKLLNEGKDLTEEEVFLASVLGWCTEWLQAYFLVHDDIMDNSDARRGKACWFRVPKVGMIAVNDGVILRNHIHRILKKHFGEKPYYVDLLDLFNEVEFQTVSGQMIDVITTIEGKKDLSKYSMQLCGREIQMLRPCHISRCAQNAHERRSYSRIAKYKCAYYSFYLPVACALLLAGENLDNHVNLKDVFIDMSEYFIVQDDYLDCFEDPEKIGTDIEDCKCSWLVVKALELCNEEQKKILFEHYGKADPADIAKVKAIYNDINLQGVFAAYERETSDKLRSTLEAHPNKAVQATWARYTRGRSQNDARL